MKLSPLNAHLLVIDDDRKLRVLLRQFLESRDFCVSDVANLSSAEAALGLFQIDLVLLDVMLLGEDGFSFFSLSCVKPPVLFLTARDGIEDRLNGLSLGAYDYLTKPFEPEELFLRIHSILRRSYHKEPHDIELGDFFFDPHQNLLKGVGRPHVLLTEGEKTLLACLVHHKNQPLSREVLARMLNQPGHPRSLDVRVGRLRAKIGQVSEFSCLQSVRGVGYILRVGS